MEEENQNTPKIKLKIHKSEHDENPQQNDDLNTKKRTIFQITAIILTILLVVAIVVEIGVMIWLKNSSNDLKNKNEKLPAQNASICLHVD